MSVRIGFYFFAGSRARAARRWVRWYVHGPGSDRVSPHGLLIQEGRPLKPDPEGAKEPKIHVSRLNDENESPVTPT